MIIVRMKRKRENSYEQNAKRLTGGFAKVGMCFVRPAMDEAGTGTSGLHLAWLKGSSKIDNPTRIGENFRKISRDEIYDRR